MLNVELALLASAQKTGKAAVQDAALLVTPGDFGNPLYGQIWEWMRTTTSPIDDMVILSNVLRLTPDVVEGLLVPPFEYDPQHLAEYAALVRELSAKRKLANLGYATAEMAENGNHSLEILSKIRDELDRLAPPGIQATAAYGTDLAAEGLAELDREEAERTDLLKTNLKPLDDLLGGLSVGEFFILMGASGVNKTTFTVWLTFQAIQQRWGVVLLGRDQSRDIYRRKFAAHLSGVDDYAIRTRCLSAPSKERVRQAYDWLNRMPLVLDTGRTLPLSGVWGQAQRMIEGLQARFPHVERVLVVADRLNQFFPDQPSGTPTQDLPKVCDFFIKMAAPDGLNVCLLSIAEITKEGARRTEERVRLTDWSYMGGYQPDGVLGMNQNPNVSTVKPTRAVDFCLLKGRGRNADPQGGVFCTLVSDPRTARFTTWEPSYGRKAQEPGPADDRSEAGT